MTHFDRRVNCMEFYFYGREAYMKLGNAGLGRLETTGFMLAWRNLGTPAKD